MTTTPESWDDVGCLRLQVDCLSQKVEDLEQAAFRGPNDSHCQKLTDEVALVQAKERAFRCETALIQAQERCLMRVCIAITAVLCACVLALLLLTTSLQVFMIYSRSAPRSTQILLDEVWKTDLDDFKASEASALGTATLTNKDKQTNMTNGQQLRKKHVNDTVAKQKEEKELLSDSKQIPQLEVWNTLLAQSTTDSEERAQRVAQSVEEDPKRVAQRVEEDPKDAREDAEDTQDKDSDEGKDQEDGEQPEEGPSSLRPLLRTRDMSELIQATQDQASKVLKQYSIGRHGVFWVCFPSSAPKQNTKKYAPTFIEVARSTKWMVYPFCHLEEPSTYQDNFCDDEDKITFVLQMEKRSVDTTNPRDEIPTLSLFDECEKAMSKAPEWFRTSFGEESFIRTYPPDQDIQASLVEEFLDDVYSGKVRKAVRPKRDL